jgi:multicomponent K+:H+ antiporter subunit C
LASACSLPQALVLTAIVIAFGMTAVLVAIAVRAHAENRHDHVDADEAP